MQFKNILIFGVGLIGGSFALAAKRAGIAQRITGWDFNDKLELALSRGVIDTIERGLDSGEAIDADLVYAAAPVGAIIDFLRKRGASLKPGAIVTDAGSTKREICRAARESLPGHVHFVGGHPMSGSQRTGIEFASADLFCGAPYALVQADGASQSGGDQTGALSLVIELVESLEARPVILTAEQHDSIVARVSHAPQLLSTALAIAGSRAGVENVNALAGSGFLDMTRLAESEWSVWEDICRTNADEITFALDELAAHVGALRVAISSGDFETAREAFRTANDFMQQLNSKRHTPFDKR
jgi:prephenate dehydrogenase